MPNPASQLNELKVQIRKLCAGFELQEIYSLLLLMGAEYVAMQAASHEDAHDTFSNAAELANDSICQIFEEGFVR